MSMLRLITLIFVFTLSGCANMTPDQIQFFQNLSRSIADGLNNATAEMNRQTEMQRRALIEQSNQPVVMPRSVQCTTTVDTSFGLNTATTTCY